MKAVLVSIRPEWCRLIVDGKKTIEVRKTCPKLETPFKCYIYCTYGQGLIERYDAVYPNMLIDQTVSKNAIWGNCCNGKVIGEFICDKTTMSIPGYKDNVAAYWELLDGTCLTADELMDYGQWKTLYGWHISSLYIYDKPLELSEFMKPCKDDLFCEVCAMYNEFRERCGNGALMIKRAPQSWCYVEEVSHEA